MQHFRKFFSIVEPFLVAILTVALALLVLSLLLTGCTPRIGDILAAQPPVTAVRYDTVYRDRTVTDTIEFGAEYVTVRDTVPCPPNLAHETLVPFEVVKWLPGKKVPVTVTVRDTVYLPAHTTSMVTSVQDMSWPERLTWLCGVLALLWGFWNTRKDGKGGNGGRLAAAG